MAQVFGQVVCHKEEDEEGENEEEKEEEEKGSNVVKFPEGALLAYGSKPAPICEDEEWDDD